MTRKISWGLLTTLVIVAGAIHFQTQWSYRAFVSLAREITLQITETALEEATQSVRVRFTIVLTNATAQPIPLEGVSCLLYAHREFIGPCVLSTDLPEAVPPHGELKIAVITEVTGPYWENYRRAQAAEVRVSGSVQLELPLGSDFVKASRRFTALIPKT
jgi:hypothetical protein